MTHLVMASLLTLAQANDKAQANSYDDAWKGAWKAHCQAVLSGGSGKTPGFVLQIGDSMTHSNPYSQWPRYGAGKTPNEDIPICAWCMATVAFPAIQNDPTSKNGFYLAAADTVSTPTAGRGMTASSGLDTHETVTGNGNGGTAMPAITVQASAAAMVADGTTYTGNLNITTIANAFPDAQFAVLMLGTNDIGGGRSTAAFLADLTAIVNTLEGMHIAVILSTIPPRASSISPPMALDVTGYNVAITNLAQTRALPLIDFYSEIQARQPGMAWLGTLINNVDGIHPTSVNSAADPYTPGGNPGIDQTGTNCLTDGYLLRSWLTIQKLKEVKSYVIDNNSVPVAPVGGGGGGSGGGGGCGATGLEAAILMALVFAYRKSGF